MRNIGETHPERNLALRDLRPDLAVGTKLQVDQGQLKGLHGSAETRYNTACSVGPSALIAEPLAGAVIGVR